MIAGVTVAVLIAAAMVIMYLQFRFQCDCGRSRPPYFFKVHEKSWVMSLWILFVLPGTVSAFFGDHPLHYVTAVVNTLLLAFHVRKWWFHEKDKMKKRAAKLAGRVGLNSHGRLVVESS